MEKTEIAETFKGQGYSQTRNSFEVGVASIATPFFQDTTDSAGCIALALPENNMTDARRDDLLPLLQGAVKKMETSLTGL